MLSIGGMILQRRARDLPEKSDFKARCGTEVELTTSAASAYEKAKSRWSVFLPNQA